MSRRKDKKAKDQFEALMAENAKTRALDRLDVREGRLSSQALSWFSQDYVRSLTLTVPDYGTPLSEARWKRRIRISPNPAKEREIRRAN